MIKAKDCHVRSGSQISSALTVTISCTRMDYCMSAVGLAGLRALKAMDTCLHLAPSAQLSLIRDHLISLQELQEGVAEIR